MVVMCAWLFDIALSAILNVARYDLGFYLGRIYGLCAASFVLAVLLIDNVALQAQLSRLLGTAAPPGRIGARLYTERERLFSAVVESSNDAIITKSLDGTITGWNRAAERLFGFTSAEAVGRRIDLIVPPDRRAEVTSILEQIARGEPIEAYETVRVHQDGRNVDVIAEHLADPIGLGRYRRRLQDRARHHRKQADGEGAGSGNRRAAAHLRDLARPHLRNR